MYVILHEHMQMNEIEDVAKCEQDGEGAKKEKEGSFPIQSSRLSRPTLNKARYHVLPIFFPFVAVANDELLSIFLFRQCLASLAV